MLLKIVYLLIRRILGFAVLLFRKNMAKDAELLVLRYQDAVLRSKAAAIGGVTWRDAGDLCDVSAAA